MVPLGARRCTRWAPGKGVSWGSALLSRSKKWGLASEIAVGPAGQREFPEKNIQMADGMVPLGSDHRHTRGSVSSVGNRGGTFSYTRLGRKKRAPRWNCLGFKKRRRPHSMPKSLSSHWR